MRRSLSALMSGAVLSMVLVMPVLAVSPVPSVNITAVGGQDATSGAVTLNVTELPTTVALEGSVSISQATVNGMDLILADNGVEFYSGRYFSGLGNEDTADFSVPWTIPSSGLHEITATVTFANNEGTDVVVVTVILNTISVNQCPAAPSVAAHYLKELGIKAGSKTYKNVISLVAWHMGPQTDFDGVKACDAGYAEVVEAYVDGHMTVSK